MIEIVALETVAAAAVEDLLDRAFGTDRQGRTAYRLRAGTEPIAELSFAAIEQGGLVGSIQCWPVALAIDAAATMPMVLVGPVAVAPDRQRGGIGRMLMDETVAAAAQTGNDAALMLIGDPDYYGRFFGFTAERTAAWRLPGPVERHRLLARGERVPDAAGTIGPLMSAIA